MGVKRLVMVSPAFSADCLETLEELDVEGKHFFMDNGGESFARVPCLNTDPAWVAVVKGWIDGVMAGDESMLESRFATHSL
jgi:ferrochelatase